MAEGYGAAVDVDAVGVNAEGADYGEGLGGEGFVALDEADFVEVQAGAVGDEGNGVDGADTHLLGQAADGGVGYQVAEGAQAEFLGATGIHEHGGGRAIGGLRGVVGGEDFFLDLRLAGFPRQRGGDGTGISSSEKRQVDCAATAFWWLAKAKA